MNKATKAKAGIFLICLLVGVAAAAAAWKGAPDNGAGVLLSFLMPVAFGLWLGFGRGQVAAVARDLDQEERYRHIAGRAGLATTLVVGWVAVAGQIYEMYQGGPGPFTLMCLVTWLTYLLSVTVLTRTS